MFPTGAFIEALSKSLLNFILFHAKWPTSKATPDGQSGSIAAQTDQKLAIFIAFGFMMQKAESVSNRYNSPAQIETFRTNRLDVEIKQSLFRNPRNT